MTPQDVMNHHAKSFSWAARFLMPEARANAAKLYAFARLADDLADEEMLGEFAYRMQQLQALEHAVLNPSAGRELAHQVGTMLRSMDIGSDVVLYFMAALRQDAVPRRFQSTEELLEFAYGVAGTVGQMMCPILGVTKQGQPYAVALGVAMQLTNIARDVVEDAERGRTYIPAQWGVDGDTLRAPQNPSQVMQSFALIQKLLHKADEFYAYAMQGLPYIPPGNRRAIHVATSLYRGIGQKILVNGAARYWRGRTSLGWFEKVRLIAACYLGTNKLRGVMVRDVVAYDLKHLAQVPGFPANG
jgi:phytoene synthase